MGAKNFIILQELEPPHPCDLELHSSLQRTTAADNGAKSAYFPYPFLNGTTKAHKF